MVGCYILTFLDLTSRLLFPVYLLSAVILLYMGYGISINLLLSCPCLM